METVDKILIKLTLAFILVWAYLLIPYSEELHYPFLFDSQGITWQAFADYAFTRIAIILLVSCIYDIYKNEYTFVFLWLWIGYFIDYILKYNQPYFHWHYIPVCYGLLAGLFMIYILLRKFLTT